MYKKIYKQIKKFDTIVIARHIGPDPDAYSSQIALRDSIILTFPKKHVLAVGSGSGKFSYLGSLDKEEENYDDALLIIVDTPDKKRVDITNIDNYKNKIKIDHHPMIETYCDIELIEDNSSSAAQLILNLINKTRLKMDKSIAEKLFLGIISDTNRLLFSNATSETFNMLGNLIKDYKLEISKLYENIYMKPFNEVRLKGYMSQNMKITSNGVGYIVITDEIIKKFDVDSASPGNMINDFNYIEEILVWVSITEDKKNDIVRISIRSRGPEINHLAELYNGGGHKYAAGIRIKVLDEYKNIIDGLDKICENYHDIEDGVIDENK